MKTIIPFMKSCILILLLFIIYNPNSNAQNLKKGFKAYKKAKYSEAEIIFKSLTPKSAAGEYGMALLYFNKDYGYNLKQAFRHIKSSDSLMQRLRKDAFKDIEAYCSKEKITALKVNIYDAIMQLNDSEFLDMYNFIHKTYWMADIKDEIRIRMINRKASLEYIVLKDELLKSYSKKTYNKLYKLIRQNKQWPLHSEASDFRDSIYAVNLKNQDERIKFLKKYPDSKYRPIVREEFIKNYTYSSKGHIVIKTADDPDIFVDSVIKNNQRYYYYIRRESQISESPVKQKVFLCLKDYDFNKNGKIYSTTVEDQQKNYPGAFLTNEGTGDKNPVYTVFSKDKVYVKNKLLSTDYQSIIFIGNHKEFDDSDHYGWFIKWAAACFNENIRVPYTFADNDYKHMEVKRIETFFWSEIDISKFEFNYKKGGVLFVKSGKKPKYFEYPKCLDIGMLINEIQRYFTNLSNTKSLK